MKNETELGLERNMGNKSRSELSAEALRAFEKWKAKLRSGRKKECTPETGLDLGARPGEVVCFGEPC